MHQVFTELTNKVVRALGLVELGAGSKLSQFAQSPNCTRNGKQFKQCQKCMDESGLQARGAPAECSQKGK